MSHINATAADHRNLFFGQFANQPEASSPWQRRMAYNKTIRALEKLSDHQLCDIGIPRSEIRHRVYQSVYHNMPYQAFA